MEDWDWRAGGRILGRSALGWCGGLGEHGIHSSGLGGRELEYWRGPALTEPLLCA